MIAPIALHFEVDVRYPFGEPAWPFQQYAHAAAGMQQSPVGLLIHPEYGLWTAFRAALMFDDLSGSGVVMGSAHPCHSCATKPCLNTCPIGAFTGDDYDYLSCKSYVGSSSGTDCFTGGCQARRSCPVGQEFEYSADHQAFHIKAYV